MERLLASRLRPAGERTRAIGLTWGSGARKLRGVGASRARRTRNQRLELAAAGPLAQAARRARRGKLLPFPAPPPSGRHPGSTRKRANSPAHHLKHLCHGLVLDWLLIHKGSKDAGWSRDRYQQV